MTYHSIKISSYSRTFPCCKHLSQGIWAAPPQLIHLKKIIKTGPSSVESCLELTFLVHVRHKLNKLRQRFAGHFEDRKRHQHGRSLFRMFQGYFISQDATIRADFSPPWSLFNPIPVRLFFTTPSPLQFQQSL